jgi:surfeit locus 1 family protein
MAKPHARRLFFIITFAAVCVGILTASLGFWQLRRAAQKEHLLAQIHDKQLLPIMTTLPMSLAGDDVSGVLHRRAQIKGQWVADATVFLDNRPMAGRAGFIILTPLRLADDGRWLWVQRGWVPRHFLHREQLPPTSTPAGEVIVSGRLVSHPSLLFELGGAESAGPIRQNVNLGALSSQRGASAAPWSLLQMQDEEAAPSEVTHVMRTLLRQWPDVDVKVQMHYGYAFQWFALCALVWGLYVWFQWIAPRRGAK